MDARQDRTGQATAQRRDQIIAIATDQFARDGYQGASLRQIAAGCGLAQGHLSYYYRTKQDLLYDTIILIQARFNDSLREAQLLAGDAGVQLRTLLHTHVAILCEYQTAAIVSYENLRFLRPDLRAEVVRSRDTYEAGLCDLIERSRAERAIASTPTHMLAKVVLGIVNWPYRWYRPDGPLSSAEIADTLTDRALAALRA